jgi:hypothetical protein
MCIPERCFTSLGMVAVVVSLEVRRFGESDNSSSAVVVRLAR